MKKIFSLLLVGVMVFSMIPAAYATTDYTNGTQVSYNAEDPDGDGIVNSNEAYTITVPALLAPGGSGTVTLEGTWASNRIVTVTADKTVTLVNSINSANTKTLDVTFAGISEAGNNIESQTFAEDVSVEKIQDALFGTWSGVFEYNVELIQPVLRFGEKYILTACNDDNFRIGEDCAQYYSDGSVVTNSPILGTLGAGTLTFVDNNTIFDTFTGLTYEVSSDGTVINGYLEDGDVAAVTWTLESAI